MNETKITVKPYEDWYGKSFICQHCKEWFMTSYDTPRFCPGCGRKITRYEMEEDSTCPYHHDYNPEVYIGCEGCETQEYCEAKKRGITDDWEKLIKIHDELQEVEG